jgi:hypothetical protein
VVTTRYTAALRTVVDHVQYSARAGFVGMHTWIDFVCSFNATKAYLDISDCYRERWLILGPLDHMYCVFIGDKESSAYKEGNIHKEWFEELMVAKHRGSHLIGFRDFLLVDS